MPSDTPTASPVRYHKSPLREKSPRRHIDFPEINGHTQKFDQSLEQRNNPRRDVTHYESPPRRRLRETEDVAIQEYHESKIFKSSQKIKI
jgi:hypothetical protein